jgi:hypothetical protein
MNSIVVEPELLGRRDTDHGRWDVSECNPRRGEPRTNIVSREMVAPTHDTVLARVIRAHEMMHAKVTPAHSYPRWVERQIATNKAMTVVEELRVNLLCQKAGFDVKGNLTDGGETADGERITATKDWHGAVLMAIATAGTASNKAFLTGVRRHNREWGIILADISKRAVKEMEKAYRTGTLASTEVDRRTGLAPLGFSHVERIAEWVDRLASIVPEEPTETSTETNGTGAGAGAGDGEGAGESQAPRKRGRPKKHNPAGGHSNGGTGDGSATGNPYKGITPDQYNGASPPQWGELRIERCAMPKHTKGNIGKKRIASNMGRAPRRIHRLLTDPEKRIFDKVSRGTGGIVVIDASGSMSFTHDQIRQMVENAPGATVVAYTDRGNTGPNMWVIADKGKMVNELPDVFGHGNGVDFPAIEWAVKNRQSSRSPIIWVTDGGVCPTSGGYSDMLGMQCINYCIKNNIIVLPYVTEAVDALKKMKNGNKVKSRWPYQFKSTYKNKMGVELS